MGKKWHSKNRLLERSKQKRKGVIKTCRRHCQMKNKAYKLSWWVGWSRQEQQHSSGVELSGMQSFKRRWGQSHLHIIWVHPHSDLLIWANQTGSFRLSDCAFKGHPLYVFTVFTLKLTGTLWSGSNWLLFSAVFLSQLLTAVFPMRVRSPDMKMTEERGQ